jgi:hypothetical protein
LDINKLLGFANQTFIEDDMLLPRVGLWDGPCIQRCPKATPSFVLYKSQLTPPIEVSLSISELGRGELPLVHHFNPGMS